MTSKKVKPAKLDRLTQGVAWQRALAVLGYCYLGQIMLAGAVLVFMLFVGILKGIVGMF